MYRPILEELEGRDCPSTITPTSTFVGLDAPPVNIATADAFTKAAMEFGQANLIQGQGFGQVPIAQADATLNSQFAVWANKIEPDGLKQIADWNASVLATNDAWIIANWTQSPPAGETVGTGNAYVMQSGYGYTPPVVAPPTLYVSPYTPPASGPLVQLTAGIIREALPAQTEPAPLIAPIPVAALANPPLPGATTPVTATFEGLQAPPIDPSTAAPADLAAAEFSLGNLNGNIGLGTTPKAEADAFLQAAHDTWFDTVLPNGQEEGDVWDASVYASLARNPADVPQTWLQSPPAGESLSAAVALPLDTLSGTNLPPLDQLLAFYALNPLVNP